MKIITATAVSSCSRNRDLPADVVEDILTRLPVQHVLRCKLLSKTYNALINNPRFINKHQLFHGSTPTNGNLVIFSTRPVGNNMVSLLPGQSDVFVPRGWTNCITGVVGSCNGLLCAKLNNQIFLNLGAPFLVWNPATRKYMALADFKFDNPRATGFGYDAVSDDYKLVMLSVDDMRRTRADIWNMKTNSWSEIDEARTRALPPNFLDHYGIGKEAGLFLRGKLYWLAHWSYVKGYHRAIISFDLTDDTFRMRILEKEGLEFYQGMSLFDYNGSLALSCSRVDMLEYCLIGDEKTEWTIHIWVQKVGEDEDDDKLVEDLSTWTQQSIGPFLFPAGLSPSIIRVNEKTLIVESEHCFEVILYDLHNKDQNKLTTNRDCTICYGPAWCYTESLVSLT